MSDRLGGALARKPLHFIFVLDVSGSMMRGGRIQAHEVDLTGGRSPAARKDSPPLPGQPSGGCILCSLAKLMAWIGNRGSRWGGEMG